MKVGLLGGGTVGGGVCEILRLRGAALKVQGAELEIKKLCVRDASKKRDFEIPAGCEVVTDPKAVIDDDSIEMVVELIGGVTVAKDVVLSAIAKGKHVITGNKALIAAHLPEIQKAVQSSPGSSFNYEAAVCGGIPIINAVKHDYVGDEITSIMGIMNGTTNFILSKMASEGANYEDVLAEAQKLGYAETPPDFDVEGWDARSKLAILCKLAFGVYVPEESIPCTGITKVTSDDFKYAEMIKATVKILGVAQRNQDGSVSAYVSVCMVPLTNQLSAVGGVLNCVSVTSKNLATCSYSGPGAGRFPTANSTMNDMVMVAKGAGRGDPFPMNNDIKVVSEVHGQFYVRFLIKEGLGIIATLGKLAEAQGVSINAILQCPIKDPSRVPFVMMSDTTTLSAIKALCAEFQKQPYCLEPPLVMPMLS
jgi:homoserine dehydrogenase